jgi:hypothetical protein
MRPERRARSAPVLGAALLGAVLAPLASPTVGAAEATENCGTTIDALPYSIGAPGVYCLGGNLSLAHAAEQAITISASNVTLDCNGHRLDGSEAGLSTLSYGILSIGRQNITVRNCRVRGFQHGMYLVQGGGHLVERNRFEANTMSGATFGGEGAVFRDNQILDTGRGTNTTSAFGLRLQSSADAIDNIIDGVTARTGGNGSAYGIQATFDSGSGSLSGNRIRNLAKDGSAGIYGIYAEAFTRVTIRDNDVIGSAGNGAGIWCYPAGTAARVRDNTLSGWTTAIEDCPSGGGNVVRP